MIAASAPGLVRKCSFSHSQDHKEPRQNVRPGRQLPTKAAVPTGRSASAKTVLLNFVTEEDAMSKTALRCSGVLIASLAVGTVAQAQTHESAIPNLASADFGWQHGFDGLNFQRVEGKVAPTGRGPVLPGVERLADDQNPNLTPWAATQMRMHNDLVKKGHRAFSAQSRCWAGGTPGQLLCLQPFSFIHAAQL